MVVFCEVTDKQDQRRRGRIVGANRFVTARRTVEENRALERPETWVNLVNRGGLEAPTR
jgi:hypothetical protein